jgi:hypothetical protein
MTQANFSRRLAALLDEFLSAGGDVWWVNQELSLAGAAATDALRCDLCDTDDDHFAADEPRGRNSA